MISPRRHSRELALKALYQAEINNSDLNESLNQILIETLFAPAIEIVVKEFLKSTKASEILSGKVEEFIPDFVDNISSNPHLEISDLRFHVKQLLEQYFSGVTINESFQPELQNLIDSLSEKIKKQSVVEDFAKEIISNISQNNKFIEETIEKTANNWSLNRMAAIDRCILKIAVSEFFYFPLIPLKATINEAIELAKKYSTDRSYEFVNGILDKISKENKFVKTPKSANQSKETDKNMDK
ncbi:MAG: transcription antitermination factor NusB [Candidatus Riflebacteria bacterium]|nr:transcription antitermination factor NusB [Candidatus Riflebacteria bacterium]